MRRLEEMGKLKPQGDKGGSVAHGPVVTSRISRINKQTLKL